MSPSPLSQLNVHLFIIRSQLCNEEISLDIFSFYKSKQRCMLCQPEDLLHYSDYVRLCNLMQAGAAMF